MKRETGEAIVSGAESTRSRNLLFIALVAAIEAVQLLIVVGRQIHMDEYLFLEQIYQFRAGELNKPLQTFYIYLFQWLTYLPVNDINKIVVGRLVMWLFHLLTLYFIYGIARRLGSRSGAMIATVVYASFLYVLQHGTSFRADPLITALLMGAIFGLTRETVGLTAAVASVVSVAIAGLISIKSIFFLPMIAVAGFWQVSRAGRKREIIGIGIAALCVGAVAFGGLLFWHLRELGSSEASLIPSILSAVEKQFAEKEPFDTLWYLFVALVFNLPNWILISIGLYRALVVFFSGDRDARFQSAVVLSFFLPVLLVFTYRNTFPYFYVFMLAPVSVIASYAGARATTTVAGRMTSPVCVLLAALALFLGIKELSYDNRGQRSVLAAVQTIFPKPVPYLDGFASIPSYPRVGYYMTSWTRAAYQRNGARLIARLVSSRKPRFAIAQHPLVLEALTKGRAISQEQPGMFPEDAEALHGNFIHHWGPLWIAGKDLDPKSSEAVEFEIVIDGQYTFEAEGPGVLDGHAVQPDDVVELSAGSHRYSGPHARFRYGDHSPVPRGTPPEALYREHIASRF